MELNCHVGARTICPRRFSPEESSTVKISRRWHAQGGFQGIMNPMKAIPKNIGIRNASNAEIQIPNKLSMYPAAEGFKSLSLELTKNFESIRFAVYRTASKLRYIQRRTLFGFIDLHQVVETFREFGLQIHDMNATIDCNSTDRLLSKIYASIMTPGKTSKGNRDSESNTKFDPMVVTVARGTLLNWLIYAMDGVVTGRLTVNGLKIALSTLTNASLTEKFRYHFSLLSDASGAMVQPKFEAYIRDILRLPFSVHEESNFVYFPNVVDEIFKGKSRMGPISLKDFLDCMLAESGSQQLAWLVILHRLASAEGVLHNVRCAGCRSASISGLRYQCTICPNYNLCQQCYWIGVATEQHTNAHAMKEYSSLTAIHQPQFGRIAPVGGPVPLSASVHSSERTTLVTTGQSDNRFEQLIHSHAEPQILIHPGMTNGVYAIQPTSYPQSHPPPPPLPTHTGLQSVQPSHFIGAGSTIHMAPTSAGHQQQRFLQQTYPNSCSITAQQDARMLHTVTNADGSQSILSSVGGWPGGMQHMNPIQNAAAAAVSGMNVRPTLYRNQQGPATMTGRLVQKADSMIYHPVSSTNTHQNPREFVGGCTDSNAGPRYLTHTLAGSKPVSDNPATVVSDENLESRTEHNLIAMYTAKLAHALTVESHPESRVLQKDASNMHRPVTAEHRTDNGLNRQTVGQNSKNPETHALRDNLSENVYSADRTENAPPVMSTELLALKRRKDELKHRMSNLQRNRTELTLQLEALERLLGSDGESTQRTPKLGRAQTRQAAEAAKLMESLAACSLNGSQSRDSTQGSHGRLDRDMLANEGRLSNLHRSLPTAGQRPNSHQNSRSLIEEHLSHRGKAAAASGSDALPFSDSELGVTELGMAGGSLSQRSRIKSLRDRKTDLSARLSMQNSMRAIYNRDNSDYSNISNISSSRPSLDGIDWSPGGLEIPSNNNNANRRGLTFKSN